MAKYKPNRVEVNVTSPMSVDKDETDSFQVNVFSRYVWDQRYTDGMLNVTATITSRDGKQSGQIVKIVGRCVFLFHNEVATTTLGHTRCAKVSSALQVKEIEKSH